MRSSRGVEDDVSMGHLDGVVRPAKIQHVSMFENSGLGIQQQ